MSGGGGNPIKRVFGATEDAANTVSLGYYDKGKNTVQDARGKVTALPGRVGLGSGSPDLPSESSTPTMEDIAAREPDKERRRRQRMAAMMAQGRQGSILTGSRGDTAASNSIGGGGKQMVGA